MVSPLILPSRSNSSRVLSRRLSLQPIHLQGMIVWRRLHTHGAAHETFRVALRLSQTRILGLAARIRVSFVTLDAEPPFVFARSD